MSLSCHFAIRVSSGNRVSPGGLWCIWHRVRATGGGLERSARRRVECAHAVLLVAAGTPKTSGPDYQQAVGGGWWLKRLAHGSYFARLRRDPSTLHNVPSLFTSLYRLSKRLVRSSPTATRLEPVSQMGMAFLGYSLCSACLLQLK